MAKLDKNANGDPSMRIRFLRKAIHELSTAADNDQRIRADPYTKQALAVYRGRLKEEES